jgi:hypothetical protein
VAGYTDPDTQTAGTVIASADWNGQVRDNFRWTAHDGSSGNPAPYATVNRSTDQTGIGNGAAIAFNSEVNDPGGMHDNVTNNSRLTIPSGGAGLYTIGFTGYFTCTYSSGAPRINFLMRKNGGNYLGGAGGAQPSVTQDVYLSASRQYVFVATDYIEVFVFFANYTAVDVKAAVEYSPLFWARWEGIG